MNFFSDERAAEMRELFFESAAELLQTLNEQGLKLEKHPLDKEVLREVRRTVHTLKGDSAACGYEQLSDLAHLLEDALTPEVAAITAESLAEVVLIAADTFGSMLSAYRGELQPPDGEELKEQIVSLTRRHAKKQPCKLQARFVWSEYEQMEIAEALQQRENVYYIALSIDPHCPMRSAALQLVRNVIQECGRVLAIVPGQSAGTQDVDVVEAAIASEYQQSEIEAKCRIPSVVLELLLRRADSAAPSLPAENETRPHAEELVSYTDTTGTNEALEEAARTNSASFSHLETLLRVDAGRIDAVLDLLGELIIAKSMLHQTVTEFDRRFPRDPLKTRFADALAFQARIMNDLQKSVMKIRMVPVEHLFRRFPRMVRDVARSCGKNVELALSGQETDLDKGILDSLAEPLAHLVRNSIDHGIESPEEREAAGKPEHGTVTLAAYHQGNQIVIEASDDGRGIDREKLLSRAIERGILPRSEAASLSEQQTLDLIFHPGLSTAEQVTSISGRGVGMDVVKTVLDRLKGTIAIRTAPGRGTTFYLKVPLTLAIIKALLFSVGDRIYAIPLAAVAEITRASRSDIHRVDNQDVIRMRDEVVTLIHLGGLNNQVQSSRKMFLVVVSLGDCKFCLVVDKLVGEEELVIKALDDHLVANDMVSGASILGDGTVVLILNTASLVSRLGRAQLTMGATA